MGKRQGEHTEKKALCEKMHIPEKRCKKAAKHLELLIEKTKEGKGIIMSKLLKSSLAALMAVALVGCSSQPAAGGNTGGGDDTQGSKVSIGFVSDVGGIDDKSFNQTSWEGIKKFADENGLKEGSDYSFLQSNNEADYIPNLSAFADKGVDLIAAAGFMFGDAITETVNAYPDQKILIIDVDWLEGENLQQAVFAEHEGSYLVGVVAGLKAMENGSKHVGMVIGQESESMFRFWAGYQQGVWADRKSVV